MKIEDLFVLLLKLLRDGDLLLKWNTFASVQKCTSVKGLNQVGGLVQAWVLTRHLHIEHCCGLIELKSEETACLDQGLLQRIKFADQRVQAS